MARIDLMQENVRKSVNVFWDFNSVIMNLELVPEDMQRNFGTAVYYYIMSAGMDK